jgi:hypothetical protein
MRKDMNGIHKSSIASVQGNHLQIACATGDMKVSGARKDIRRTERSPSQGVKLDTNSDEITYKDITSTWDSLYLNLA